MKQAVVLGAQVHGVTMDEAVETAAEFIRSGMPHQVITLNAEILYRAHGDPVLLNVVNSAHMVTPDGAGIVWACRRLGQPVPERVTGIDLMQALAARAEQEGWRIFLYGAASGVADAAAEELLARHPRLLITGVSHGYLDAQQQEELVASIRKTAPDILFVALGAPRQDLWIHENLEKLDVPVCIGVGGSLDVIAGRVKRAPQLVQNLKLEWLYRLLREPSRYRRMLALPKFVLAVLKMSVRKGAR